MLGQSMLGQNRGFVARKKFEKHENLILQREKYGDESAIEQRSISQ